MKKCFLITLIAILPAGCQKSDLIRYVDPDDPFIGYYQVPSRQNTIIPVFKIEETYYSVCRGAEIPLKQTPEGLQWALEPSSMVGTTIGIKAGQPFIIIRDAQAENFTSESEYPHNTEPHPMTRIEKPSWMLDPTASPPRSVDDFVGCFEPVWFPYFRWDIQKNSDEYLVSLYMIDKEGQKLTWKTQDNQNNQKLTLLSDKLGFDFSDRNTQSVLIYNDSLKRFEYHSKEDTGPEIKMPLVRISDAYNDGSATPDILPIGIPTWH